MVRFGEKLGCGCVSAGVCAGRGGIREATRVEMGETVPSGQLHMVPAWFAESDFQRDTLEAPHPAPPTTSVTKALTQNHEGKTVACHCHGLSLGFYSPLGALSKELPEKSTSTAVVWFYSHTWL